MWFLTASYAAMHVRFVYGWRTSGAYLVEIAGLKCRSLILAIFVILFLHIPIIYGIAIAFE
jgi:hypothetical protein